MVIWSDRQLVHSKICKKRRFNPKLCVRCCLCVSELSSAFIPTFVAQSDARPTGDEEVAGLIPAGCDNIFFFVDIVHEIFSTAIFSLPLIQEGQRKNMREYWLACPGKVWWCKLTGSTCFNNVYWSVQRQPNKTTIVRNTNYTDHTKGKIVFERALGSDSSRACAKSHPVTFSPLIHSICLIILLADSEGPDQTARTRRLIWAIAVRICPKTRFRMNRHNYHARLYM